MLYSIQNNSHQTLNLLTLLVLLLLLYAQADVITGTDGDSNKDVTNIDGGSDDDVSVSTVNTDDLADCIEVRLEKNLKHLLLFLQLHNSNNHSL